MSHDSPRNGCAGFTAGSAPEGIAGITERGRTKLDLATSANLTFRQIDWAPRRSWNRLTGLIRKIPPGNFAVLL
jgi:hypothetical protein